MGRRSRPRDRATKGEAAADQEAVGAGGGGGGDAGGRGGYLSPNASGILLLRRLTSGVLASAGRSG